MANLKMRGFAEEWELLRNEKGDLGITLVRSADSRVREELFSLFSGLECWVKCWAPSMRQGDTGVSPGKGHKHLCRTGTSVLQGEAEGTGTVQPGAEKAQYTDITLKSV